jgi:hypothetical protein
LGFLLDGFNELPILDPNEAPVTNPSPRVLSMILSEIQLSMLSLVLSLVFFTTSVLVIAKAGFITALSAAFIATVLGGWIPAMVVVAVFVLALEWAVFVFNTLCAR